MSIQEINEALLGQVRQLERQLFEVRRQLGPARAGVPSRDLDLLEVHVGEGAYGIEIEPIMTVLPMLWPQPLPEAPPWVLGTFQYGREVVPLIDLHTRLGGIRADLELSWKVVLIRHRHAIGFVVSSVGEVFRAEAGSLLPPSAEITQAPFLLASLPRPGGATIHLLSTEHLSRDYILEE